MYRVVAVVKCFTSEAISGCKLSRSIWVNSFDLGYQLQGRTRLSTCVTEEQSIRQVHAHAWRRVAMQRAAHHLLVGGAAQYSVVREHLRHIHSHSNPPVRAVLRSNVHIRMLKPGPVSLLRMHGPRFERVQFT